MSASFQIDDKVLRSYLAKAPDSFQEILNRKMFFILRAAQQGTPKADASKIESELGVIGYKVSRSRKTGNFRRGKAVTSGPTAAMIINAARGRAGLKGLTRKAMAKAVNALVARRRTAVGTLRRGWNRALSMFAAASGSGSANIEPGRRPKGFGGGRAATPGINPEAEATYDLNIDAHRPGAVNYNPKKHFDPRVDPRVQQALEAAFRAEESNMREYVERKIAEDLAASGY